MTYYSLTKWAPEPGMTEIECAVTPEGHYIGDEESAKYLCDILGIKPELASPDHLVCSIGFSEKDQKWHGWSHRARCSFGIGSTVKFGDCAYVPENWADACRAAANFWDDEHHRETKAEKAVGEDGEEIIRVSWIYADTVPNEKLRGTIGGATSRPPATWGKGQWTAASLDDAKQMAIDFAESVG